LKDLPVIYLSLRAIDVVFTSHTNYINSLFTEIILVSRYVEVIKIHQDFPEL